MATKKQKTSLQDALGRDLVGKGIAELDSDLRALFKTLKGDELLEAVIARVQRYAVKASGKTVDRDFSRLDSYDADEIKEHIREKLIRGVFRPLSQMNIGNLSSAVMRGDSLLLMRFGR